MLRSPFLPSFSELPAEIPVFPLGGAVVMPGVQLPLNIFEARYLNMVEAALAADHLIGMVQPLTEETSGGGAALHRVGCVGRITSYSETNDGRIVMVLTGVCRFEIGQELEQWHGFRRVRASWERFAGDFSSDEASLGDRDRFLASLRAFVDLRGVEIPWDDIGRMADNELVNLLCAHLPLSVDDKQALIETIDLHERAELMCGLMEMSARAGSASAQQHH